MPYFTSKQDKGERVAKVLADVFCGIMLATFAVVFFGWIGGLIAFAVVEVCLLAVDWLVPSADDAAAVVR
ncbi:hypothetical protein AOQ72_26375 [Bradyrhizobium yuanmingense]|uniref:Uncharacterized protein n=1 Tax=Bradyrhizobium yuanmingense TaxID=108015 RepID=A0A0R3C9X5_9BRAD|nr:hypothetical protein [Bradyrhizobium yuanmingense]KRP93164.1 hypothetical protein AOQ72_26375 [Bradyrhizobium yuanmingense]